MQLQPANSVHPKQEDTNFRMEDYLDHNALTAWQSNVCRRVQKSHVDHASHQVLNSWCKSDTPRYNKSK